MIREWIHDRRTTLNRKQERKMRLILVNVYEHHLLYKKYHNRKIHRISHGTNLSSHPIPWIHVSSKVVPWDVQDKKFVPSHPIDPCFIPTRPMGYLGEVISSHGMGWDGMGRDGIVPSHSELWLMVF